MVARKTAVAPTRVWSFGARPFTQNSEVVAEQIRLADEYYNALVSIHQDRWYGQRRTLREHCPEFARLDDQCRALKGQIKEVYSKTKEARQAHYRDTGKKALLPPEDQAQVSALEEEIKPLSKARSEALKAHYAGHAEVKEEFKRRVDAQNPNNQTLAAIRVSVLGEMADADPSWIADRRLEDACVAKLKEKRAVCGLTSGTYLQTEEAANKAAKMRMALGQPAYLDPERARPAKIAVQLAKRSNGTSCTWGEVLGGGNNFFQLRSTGGKKPKEFYVAMIRVGAEGKEPVWAEIPVRIHRHPPLDAVVKWAWVVIRKQGERKRYELQVTLEHEVFSEPKRPAGVGEGAHIQIGWARHPQGVLLAKGPWDVVLPTSILRQAEHAARIRSHADTHYNDMRVVIGEKPVPHVTEKERILVRTEYLDIAQKTFPNLKALWGEWKEHRLGGGEDLFCLAAVAEEWITKKGVTPEQARAWYLYLWARKDMHLRQYQADSQRRFEARRDAFFKREAIRIATAFETITVDKYDIAVLKKQPELRTPEDPGNKVAQTMLQYAAPGRFRDLLVETMGGRCTKIERPGGIEKPGTSRKAKNKGSAGAGGATAVARVLSAAE